MRIHSRPLKGKDSAKWIHKLRSPLTVSPYSIKLSLGSAACWALFPYGMWVCFIACPWLAWSISADQSPKNDASLCLQNCTKLCQTHCKCKCGQHLLQVVLTARVADKRKWTQQKSTWAATGDGCNCSRYGDHCCLHATKHHTQSNLSTSIKC